jgi:hypothetical protein
MKSVESLRLLPLLLVMIAFRGAWAGDWVATLPSGLRVAIVQDTTRVRDGYLLERRYPDGSPDPQFGDGGSLVFSLGSDNEGPAALGLDTQGRAWVAGASQSSDGQRAVLLRFTIAGQADRGFAQAGRAAVAPAGREARATDVLPQDDGSAWVAGLVVDANGDERSGIWRVRNDGSVDPGFGLGGLWLDKGLGATDSGGLLRSPEGQFALGVRRVEGGRATLEVWAWLERAEPQRVQTAALADARQLDRAKLAWRDGRWQWIETTKPATAVTMPAPPPAAEVPADSPGGAIATPFSARPQAAASAVIGAAASTPLAGDMVWWLLLPAAMVAGGWWWRRARASPHE